ncbi:hypothetical protein EG329_011864 [Mollisiaceae sp. DMI_Dod_QoI]|nr:hypothetical protein EG329_011864 [Helotiales sp. DMI_Dod_QoI]
MDSEYQYIPLEGLPTGTIRLLELLPGDVDEPLRCHLHVATARDKFIALSYVWGVDLPTCAIEIDGRPFYVRQNLFACLSTLRDQAVSQLLWADAVCVNQRDILERNSQVKLMSQIFGSASLVIAWLGVNPEYADRLLGPVPASSEHLQEPVPEHGRDKSLTDNSSKMITQGIQYLEVTSKMLFDLCTRPYWTRMWIVQEVVLAKELELQYGRFRIPWSLLMEWSAYVLACEKLEQDREDDPGGGVLRKCSLPMRLAGLEKLARDRKSYQEKTAQLELSGDTFYKLLLDYCLRQCTDPRDKIIPMLELTWYLRGGSDETRDKINYYEMSESQLYKYVSNLFEEEVLIEPSSIQRMVGESSELLEDVQERLLKETRLRFIDQHEEERQKETKALLEAELAWLESERIRLESQVARLEEHQKAEIERLEVENTLLEFGNAIAEVTVALLKSVLEGE